MVLEYVDVATGKDRRGTQIVTASAVASPWSEAAKGLFEVPPELWAHRTRMFDRYLKLPIRLS